MRYPCLTLWELILRETFTPNQEAVAADLGYWQEAFEAQKQGSPLGNVTKMEAEKRVKRV